MLRLTRCAYLRSQLFKAVRNFSTSEGSIKDGWEAVIGIEVHAQLNTKTKLFSDSSTSYNEHVNTHVSAIDAAFPGVQPRLNIHAVEQAVKAALSLQGQIQKRSTFERKHYYYPDLPQGYQITQQREPISRGGFIQLTELDGAKIPAKIGIHQIQIEQDTGKSIHDMRPGESLLDLNRAGIGLIEIVSKPDIRSSYEAGLYVKKLQQLLQWVDVSKANLEEGSMRCDVNVSVRKQGDSQFGTRCELKNLNRIRILSAAIDAEVTRQIELLENGIPVHVETRRYDELRNTTYKLRDKESAPDYRFMPEPDLPPLLLSEDFIDRIANSLPELPDVSLDRIMKQYNLSLFNANLLLHEYKCLDYFERVCEGRDPNTVTKWMLNELSGALAAKDKTFKDNPISSKRFGGLLDLLEKGTTTVNKGKLLLKLMLDDPSEPLDIVRKNGWLTMSDSAQLESICKDIVEKNADKAKALKNGNLKLFKWFIGKAMGHTKGMADPVALNQSLSRSLGYKSYDDLAAAVADVGQQSIKHAEKKGDK